MAHGANTQFEWLDGTPKWDDGRKRVWLKWKWYDPYFTGELTKYLDHFEIQIRYSFKNANGGIETQQKSPESMSDFRDGDYEFNYYWEVPAECLTVEFAIHAIAKTDSQNGGSVPYFEDDPWPAPPFYCGDATVPDKPSAPFVSHNAQIGTQVVLGLDNVRDGDNNQNVVQVEFQTVYYDTDPETELGEGIKVQRTEKAKVDEFGNARALVYIGNKYGYKFRARLCGVRDKDAGGTIERQIEVFSEWSELTDIVLGVPERPSLTMRKYTDVVAEYQIKAKNSYDHYQIQSAQTLDSFDEFDDWEREYPQFKENSDERTAALQNCGVNERSDSRQNGWINVTSLEAGKAYWRVRSVTAQSDGFYSTWSEPFELTFGEKLRAPIVSMGQAFANLDDDNTIRLIIRHNSPNGSPTCRCDIHLRVGAGGEVLPWFDTIRPEDMTVGQNNDGSYTYYYDLNLKDSRINLQQEDTITWYAYTFEGNRAAESMETRSPHSEHVTFWVYEKPSVELALLSQNGESMPVEEGQYILPGFPIRLVTSSNFGEKKVVSWNIRIIPTISYYNTGRHGEREVVNAGSVLYNQIDVKTPTDLDKLILANEVSLDQGVVYILEVTAAINTGVTVTTTAEFKMVFTGAKVSIECASSYNFDNISLGLCPSVWKEEGTGFNPDPPTLITPTIADDPTVGEEPEPTTAKVLDPNYTLSVYRKNDDGTFVTIAENLINTEAAFVTDPHPNLGGSEYRIVATDTTTGQMIFYDPPPYDMKCTDIIIQWDEEYADIPFNDDSRETIRQFGSFVRLPYNIDVSESANMENSMVNYIGRKNPVSYYGTQTGYTASWSTEIPKYDTQTIKMLRRLQVYPGDVYVREPSGTGYWAHVTVSFPINHCALTVSVSLSITRVEGGM